MIICNSIISTPAFSLIDTPLLPGVRLMLVLAHQRVYLVNELINILETTIYRSKTDIRNSIRFLQLLHRQFTEEMT